MTRRPLLLLLLLATTLSVSWGCDNPKRPATAGQTASTGAATAGATTAGATTAGAATAAKGCLASEHEVFWCKLKGGGELLVCGQLLDEAHKEETLRVVGTLKGKPVNLTLRGEEIAGASYWNATGPIANHHALQIPTSATTSITPYTITLEGKKLGEGVWINRERTAEDDAKDSTDAPVQMPSSLKKKLPRPDVQTDDVPCEGAARQQFVTYASAPLTRIDQQWPHKLGAIPHAHTSVP